ITEMAMQIAKMISGMKMLACTAALAGGLCLTNAVAGQLETLPVFSLPDIDGKVWNSASFIGKPVVVDFWATWCNTCKETIPKLAELSAKYKGNRSTVIGISVDKGSAEKIAKAAKKLGINYLVLLDKDN